jgi:hypothetical protein
LIDEESTMNPQKWIVALFAAAMVCGLSANVFAQKFKPFTDVADKCPDCAKPDGDDLHFSNGDVVRGEIVGMNSDFYVVLRYGEVRAVPKSELDRVEWKDGRERSEVGNYDQILLKNGHVLSGKITKEEDEPSMFQLEASFAEFTFTAFKDQVDKVYKNGTEYSFETSSSKVDEDD